MKVINTFFLVLLLLGITSPISAQKWESSEVKIGDTTIQTSILIEDGIHAVDSTGTHKIIYKYLNFYLIEWRRYTLDNQLAEDERGVHRKEKFWKYFKFFDKKGKQFLTVRDAYHYEHGDATYCIYLCNEQGQLIEVSYFKDEVVYDKEKRFVVRNQLKAVDAYEGAIHKYVYTYSTNGKTLKEYLFDKNDRLKDIKTLKLIKPSKANKKK